MGGVSLPGRCVAGDAERRRRGEGEQAECRLSAASPGAPLLGVRRYGTRHGRRQNRLRPYHYVEYPSGITLLCVVDVKPAKGHRVVMQTFPGGIYSGMDYYISSSGLMLTETTIDQTRFDPQGTPLATRARHALQYANTIDGLVKELSVRNNGLYTNEWLIGDANTNEIAVFEQGTNAQRLRRSSKNEWLIPGREGLTGAAITPRTCTSGSTLCPPRWQTGRRLLTPGGSRPCLAANVSRTPRQDRCRLRQAGLQRAPAGENPFTRCQGHDLGVGQGTAQPCALWPSLRTRVGTGTMAEGPVQDHSPAGAERLDRDRPRSTDPNGSGSRRFIRHGP